MTTLTRWWAPEGEVPVAQLLRPGTDPEKDLGLGLLALHKAGAEACQLVAKTAVADEHVLAAALAETRALTAPLAVETISKSVESPAYAGLLLKDLLDDAEVAALALYRTCLAKSVAPPIAAERVGAVFGVASRDMAKYAALASDPKANARAVADLADRTLFDYVSKVVSEEYVPAKETFSKAPARDWHGKDPGERDPRSGEFVRTRTKSGVDLDSLFAQAEAREAEEMAAIGKPAQDVSTGPKQVAGRGLRTLKTLKTQKTLRTLKTQQSQSTVGASTLSSASLKANLLGATLSAEAVSLQGVVTFEPSPMPLGGMPRSVPRLDLADDTPGPNGVIDRAVSFVLPDNEFLAVSRQAGDTAAGKNVLRLGPLEEYAGQARLYDDGRGGLHEHHVSGVEHMLDLLNGQTGEGAATPQVGAVPAHLVTQGGQVDEAKLRAAKQRFVEMQAEKLGLRVNVAQEISKVRHAALKGDMGQMALVWRPPSRDAQGRTQQAPIPGIVEVVVKKGVARGAVSAGGRVDLQGATPVQMRSLFDKNASQDERLQVWDNDLGAFRTVVVLEGASEEDIASARWKHSKAVSRDDPATRYYDARDSAGRFASGQLQALFDQAEAREQAPKKAVQMAKPRQMRTMATQRTLRTQKAPTTQLRGAHLRGETLAAVQISPESLKAHTLAVKQAKARKNDLDGLLFLDDDADYSVLAPWTLSTMLQMSDAEMLIEEGSVVELSTGARRFMAEHGVAQGDEAAVEASVNATTAWNRARSKATAEDMLMPTSAQGERAVLTHTLTDREELSLLAGFVADAMDLDASLHVLKVRATPQRDGRIRLVITGNVESLPEQHVVGLDEVGELSDTKRLVAGKTYRVQNRHSIEYLLGVTLDRMDTLGTSVEDTLANPVVRLWRAEEQP